MSNTRRKSRVIVSDIHLGSDNNNEENLNVVLNLFKKISDYCIINNINNIDILGDFFDNRKNISLLTLFYAFEVAKILNNFSTNIILGNHDAFYKDRPTPNSISIFSEKYKNIRIIDEDIYYEDGIAFVPYFSQNKINDIPIDIKTVFGHFDINGFVYNPKVISSGCSLNIQDFNRFDIVLSGHYHIRSNNSNIWYVGSPYQMNFGEVDHTFGFHCLSENNELNFIEFNEYSKYKIIYFNQNFEKIDIENNNVKIIFTEELSQKEILEIIEKVQFFKPRKLLTDFTKISLIENEENIQVEDIEIENTEDLFKHYLSIVKIPNHLDSKNIIKIFNGLLYGE